jgi:nitroimidazol reductase NimA-like FMN-containing flavoprotein (pyridoxamine 5'-phosphate oxidase superfamily)
MKKYKIESQEKIDEIIRKAQVCTLSMVDGNEAYAIPMNFGYVDGCIILHSAPTGKKFDVLEKNNKVCISFFVDEAMNIRHEKVACSYSMKFKSVLAFGKLVDIEGIKEKTDAMNEVMKQYTGKTFTYNDPAIKGVRLMKVKVEKFTAFNRGYDE